jgi:integrase
MMGHLRERPEGSGNWYAVIDMRDGKRKWFSLKATGKRQAQIECAGIISSIEGGTYLEPNKTTLASFVVHWLNDIKARVSPRTHERYVQIIHTNIIPLLGGTSLRDLRPQAISAAYAKALAEGRKDGTGGLSPRSVHHMHTVLKAALTQAVRWELLSRNPASAVRAPKVEPRLMATYDLPQTVALIDAFQGTRMFIPVLLAVLCGLRRGEIAALRWDRINLDSGQLAVVESAEQTKAGVRYKSPNQAKGERLHYQTRLSRNCAPIVSTKRKTCCALVSGRRRRRSFALGRMVCRYNRTRLRSIGIRTLPRPPCRAFASMICGTPMRRIYYHRASIRKLPASGWDTARWASP